MTTDDDLSMLSGWTDDEILHDGVRATGVLYAAAALEELELIEFVERLNELNQHKMLSIGAGPASNLLHEFWDSGYKRMPAKRRAALFARVLGTTPAGEGAESNDAFGDLFARLVAALADGPATDVAPAASALRDNLAEHTDEATSKAAVELRATIAAISEVLSDMELRSAYRADDMWQLVATVQTEWGGEPDVERVRTRAAAGAAILHRLPELADGSEAGDGAVAAAARAWLPANAPAV
jgi:hypothetical protein